MNYLAAPKRKCDCS